MWHASVAYQGPRGPIAIERWGDGVNRQARRLLAAALDGVGTGLTVEAVVGKCVLHQRRGLSDDELKLLSADWLAIPARDEFGPDGQMETRL